MAPAPANEKVRVKKPPGRPKGVPNKTTRLVKEAISYAFQAIGGQPALAQWARENPTEFYTKVLPKLLPLEVTGADGGPLTIAVTFGGVVQGVKVPE